MMHIRAASQRFIHRIMTRAGKRDAFLFLDWLLRDDFNDTRAAGSVNGTNATPGPGGPRVVTDTESKLSLTGGSLVFAGGKATPAWGDPAIWWAAQTRAAGLALFGTISATTIAHAVFGFDTNQASTFLAMGARLNATTKMLSTYQDATGGPNIAQLVDATEYDVAIIVRSAGMFISIKGGAFTTWQLLAVLDTNTAATLYPGIANYNAIGLSADFVHVVQLPAAMIPQAALADSFTGTTAASDGVRNNGDMSEGAGIAHLNPARWSIAGGNAYNAPVPGAELLTNGDFADWTGDDPDGWTVVFEAGGDEVTEVATGESHVDAPTPGGGMANFYGVTPGFYAPRLTQTILTVGKFYRLSLTVDTVVTAFISMGDTANGMLSAFDTPTTRTWTGRAKSTKLQFIPAVNGCDITVDNASVKELTLAECIGAAATWTAPDITDGIYRAGLTVAEYFQAGMVFAVDNLLAPTGGFIGYYDQNFNGVKVWDINGAAERVSVAAAHVPGAVLEFSLVDIDGTPTLTAWYNNVWLASTAVSRTGTGTQYHPFSTDSTNAIHFFEAQKATDLNFDRYFV